MPDLPSGVRLDFVDDSWQLNPNLTLNLGEHDLAGEWCRYALEFDQNGIRRTRDVSPNAPIVAVGQIVTW